MNPLTSLALCLASYGPQEPSITYRVSFENAAHHEANIDVRVEGIPSGPLLMCMARSSPGRYALHEFAKNIYSVSARDSTGRELRIERPNNHQWRLPDQDGSVSLSYTLFADRADGTYSQVDPSHAHLNMPASFLWPRELPNAAITISFEPPAGSNWQVATQLFPGAHPLSFQAPNLQYFMDSPTELSAFSLRQWTVGERDGREQVLRLAVHHAGSEQEVDRFADWAKRLVAEQQAVFGELPDFDGGVYTFIADYLPQASGDGMEHRNSTILSSNLALADSALGLIRTLSHEFFHCWNVERIRPASLEPFDFERANMSRELWFAEGFTSYFDKLFMCRAGILDEAGYLEQIAPRLLQVIGTSALRYASPVEMSMQAPFVDAATSVDPHNRDNTFISYYTIGSAIGLALDLSLRSRFDLTLDDYMRLAWQRFGRAELAYDVEQLEALLAEFSLDADFASDFFRRHVRGRELPDFQALLSLAGVQLSPRAAERPWLGYAQLAAHAEGIQLETASRVGTPLYAAGLDRGDVIRRLDGRALKSLAELYSWLAAQAPDAEFELEFMRRGQAGAGRLRLAADPSLQLSLFESVGLEPSAAMLALRASWLGSRAGD